MQAKPIISTIALTLRMVAYGEKFRMCTSFYRLFHTDFYSHIIKDKKRQKARYRGLSVIMPHLPSILRTASSPVDYDGHSSPQEWLAWIAITSLGARKELKMTAQMSTEEEEEDEHHACDSAYQSWLFALLIPLSKYVHSSPPQVGVAIFHCIKLHCMDGGAGIEYEEIAYKLLGKLSAELFIAKPELIGDLFTMLHGPCRTTEALCVRSINILRILQGLPSALLAPHAAAFVRAMYLALAPAAASLIPKLIQSIPVEALIAHQDEIMKGLVDGWKKSTPFLNVHSDVWRNLPYK